MERTYWIGLVFALIVLLAVFFRMRNAGILAFFVAGIVMMLVSLQLSVDASRADEERRRLVEEIAILNLRVEELEAHSAGSGGPADSADSPRS